MDLLQDNVKRLYFKFLTAAFGSALISSIYGVVAMAVVGQYHGPRGSAAMGVIEPVWNLIYSLGLLTGIGGSVLFSVEKEKRQDDPDAANACFTVAAAATGAIALAIWALFLYAQENAAEPIAYATLSEGSQEATFTNLTSAVSYKVGGKLTGGTAPVTLTITD